MYLPVWNYYSGHELSYQVSADTNELPEGVDVVSEVLPTFVESK